MIKVKMTARFIEQALTAYPDGKWTRVVKGIPEGAELQSVVFDGEVVVLGFYHPRFEYRDEPITLEACYAPQGWDSV
ncbi:MAG: hypothetical protein K2X87_09290 [Gemmataceae bacterium]|nr:hypothetical protein [Gemmataceae bacterium]